MGERSRALPFGFALLLGACGLDVTGQLVAGGDAAVESGRDASLPIQADAETPLDAATDVADDVDDGGGGPTPGDASFDVVLTDADAAAVVDAGCSTSGSQPVALTFKNDSASTTYEKIWIDYQCKPVSYGTIGPGASQSISSYATHVWEFRDTTTSTIAKSVRLPATTPYTITLP